MNQKLTNPKDVVMAYIEALDSGDYETAVGLIDEEVRIIGPVQESFGNPRAFVGMLQKYGGKYEIKKAFEDGSDVCLLYDYRTSENVVYMSSWYTVKDGKIVFIRSIFDPASFV